MNLNYNKHLQQLYYCRCSSSNVYKTMILPLIEYGDILYDNSNTKLTKKLQTLQNRCLRICSLEAYHVPVIYLHEISNIARLDLRRKMHLILYMYKQKRNISIINTRDVCSAHDAVLFLFMRSNSEKYKNNVLFKGAVLWNALSVEERKIQTY